LEDLTQPESKKISVIGKQTVADDVLDRIVHKDHRVELKGDSLRKNLLKKLKKSPDQ